MSTANFSIHIKIQNIISVVYSWRKPKSKIKLQPYFASTIVAAGKHCKISKRFTKYDKTNGWKLDFPFWAYSGHMTGSRVKYNEKI